jgi:hypothetical protein
MVTIACCLLLFFGDMESQIKIDSLQLNFSCMCVLESSRRRSSLVGKNENYTNFVMCELSAFEFLKIILDVEDHS